MYRDAENVEQGRAADSRPAREYVERHERRERREYVPHRQPAVSRDPFFDQPYEPGAPAQSLPSWEVSARAEAPRKGMSANIKPRKKIAALFKSV